MTEWEIFQQLFEISGRAKDPRGVVAAGLVSDGKIIATAASSDDGRQHAENILLENVGNMATSCVLYCTLEPCSQRTDPTMKDCVTSIIAAGVRQVVFGARDPHQSDLTHKKLNEAGVQLRQVEDKELIKKCADIFNKSVSPEHIGLDVQLKPTD